MRRRPPPPVDDPLLHRARRLGRLAAALRETRPADPAEARRLLQGAVAELAGVLRRMRSERDRIARELEAAARGARAFAAYRAAGGPGARSVRGRRS
ncbi:hypothetical protein A33M_2694 [Rhodovulum sp. PH10]|uniref:hypothetical protein n=1 Tax=Rhodovulum sp. PH10 TaxID=1187851 RepID=UPI00027C2504|nr:hypothetical protein [Rhodovulum sp. PH10]EJW11913.1 hypothetical protein A33M_2694 [Rhodovulum sp. PH10]